MSNPSLTLTRFILNLVKPYKRFLFVLGLTGLSWAFISTYAPYVLKLIIDHVVNFNSDKSLLFKTTQFLIIAYIALWLVQSMTLRLLDWVKLKFFPRLREDVMVSMFAYLQQHSHRYFQNQFAGSLVNKILDMQGSIVQIFTIVDDLYAQTLGVIVAIIVLLVIHPVFALILFGWICAFLLITFLYLKPIQQLSLVFSESKTTVVGRMVDSVSNILNIRLFARHADENRYIHHSIDQACSNDRAMQRKIIHMRIFWDASIIVLIGLNLYILLYLYSNNRVSIGDFTFVMTLSVNVLWSLWYVAGQFVSFSENIGYCKQALSILSQPHEMIDAPHAEPLVIKQGKIQFHNVTFHYNEGSALFKNKNIVIEGGQKVGLVGFSGSGKSTFVNLILRLFDVESGEITIDDQNIKQVTQQSLREQIGLIPQDITLFHRTLMENIQFGNPSATEEEVMEISKRAHCHEFITQLLEGYQSLVGERGVKLSGGQRQRIAIARAMLKDAPILIMDEATSSLDSVTENYIQDALNLLMSGKTTIVIAHRLSTLAKMDRILVFDKGMIIEDGMHEELLSQDGHYAKMWHMQAGGFLPDHNGV